MLDAYAGFLDRLRRDIAATAMSRLSFCMVQHMGFRSGETIRVASVAA